MREPMQRFMDLLTFTQPLPHQGERAAPRAAARGLLEAAHEQAILDLHGPWHLHPACASALSRQHGITPPGGWSALAGVMAGATLLAVREQGFVPLMTLDTFDALSDTEIDRMLIESLAIRLVPPTTAAGLFLTLGLHPAWGLRLANEIHRAVAESEHTDRDDGAPEIMQGVDTARLFARATLGVVERGVFRTISAILEVCRALEGRQAYSTGMFAHVVLDICERARAQMTEERGARRDGELELFFDAIVGHNEFETTRRALDIVVSDLFDRFLVPIGAVRRFDDQSFCIWPEAIPGSVTPYNQEPLRDAICLCRTLWSESIQVA